MNICMCGSQDGYPHDHFCPYPLFLATDEQWHKWEDSYQAKKEATMNYEKRAAELTRSSPPGRTPTVQPAEARAIRAACPDDNAAMAALEALARPRIAYNWNQAGGHPRPGDTPELIQAGREYYTAHPPRPGGYPEGTINGK